MSLNRPLAGCRVLVVEDEYFIGDDLLEFLTAAGATVIGPVPRLDQALDQVRNDVFEVVILDINLRGEMSFPIADEMRRQNIPFVFVTGYHKEAIPKCFADVERWEKPFNMEYFVEATVRLRPQSRFSLQPPLQLRNKAEQR